MLMDEIDKCKELERTIDALRKENADLKAQIAGARLEEAKWWADGHHGAIIEARFHGACPKCERITDLEKQGEGKGRNTKRA